MSLYDMFEEADIQLKTKRPAGIRFKIGDKVDFVDYPDGIYLSDEKLVVVIDSIFVGVLPRKCIFNKYGDYEKVGL